MIYIYILYISYNIYIYVYIYSGWHPLWQRHVKALWFQTALTAYLDCFFRIGRKISKLAASTASTASNFLNDKMSGTQSMHSGQAGSLH